MGEFIKAAIIGEPVLICYVELLGTKEAEEIYEAMEQSVVFSYNLGKALSEIKLGESDW